MGTGRYRLQKNVKAFEKTKPSTVIEVPGLLGIKLGGKTLVEVPNRTGYVFVRLRGDRSELIQAYNSEVTPIYDLPVLCVRSEIDQGRWFVIGRDVSRYQNWGASAFLPKHGDSHSFNPDVPGIDPVWIWGRQMMPLAAVPNSGSAGSNNLLVEQGVYYQNGEWHVAGGTGTASVLPYKPTGSNAVMVLLYIDENTQFQFLRGAEFVLGITGTAEMVSHLPALPTTYSLPIAGILLVSGTSVIGWDNIFDVRPWMVGDGFIPTGSFSGYNTIQDDGVAQTQRSALNFVGSGFQVYDGGGVTNVSGTVSNGYNTVQDDGVDKTQRQKLNFVGAGFSVYDGGGVTNVSGTASGAGDMLKSVYDTNNDGMVDHAPWSGLSGTPIKLDDLSAPDDNTDLNVSTGTHGLFPKLPGGITTYWRADGTWQVPAGGSGGRTLIESQTVTSTGTAVITFDSIPSTYWALQLEYMAASVVAGAVDYIKIRFNGDALDTFDYESERFISYEATHSSYEATSNYIGYCPGATIFNAYPAGGMGIVQIPGYVQTIFQKYAFAENVYPNNSSSLNEAQRVVWWMDISAINQIDLVLSLGSFVSGSVFRLYGLT